MMKTKKKIAGFSLIELLFAMLFLSIIVFGVIKLQTSNLTLSNTKQLELKAHSYATQGLEIASALGYSLVHTKYSCSTGPCDCEITFSGTYGFTCTGTAEAIPPLYDRTITLDPSDLTNAYMATALIEWTDSSGYHTISAKRIISN